MITTVGFRRMQIHCHSTYNNNNIEISSDEETTNEKVMHKSILETLSIQQEI